MPSAGALCPPQITPIRRIPDRIQLPVNHIDVNSLIELSTESNNCKIFFTTDGTKPCPFQRKIAGREVTYKYIAPFTLKPGKRVLKAVCTTRDGLQESAVVTKTFNVDELIEETVETSDGYDYSSYSSFFETSDTDTSKSTVKSRSKPKKRQKSPTRKPRSHVTREAWASEGDVEGRDVGAMGETAYPPVPDGPFNPTNYSGTQINVWGGAPPGVVNGQPGNLIFGGSPQAPYPVQYGFLTEQMIQKLNAANRPVTVGELRHLMEEASRNQAPPPPPPPPVPAPAPKPAIEYKPVYKDPPLEPVSPGKGDFKGNLLHVYAHMLEHAKNNGDFRLRVAEPRMGKVLEGKLEDEGDGYRLTVVLSKPGVPRGTVKKKKPPPAAAPPPAHPPRKPTGSASDTSKKSEKQEKPKKKDPPVKKDPYYAMETEDLNQEGTVVPYAAFNAEQDAEVLKQAMKGLGTDENAIINVLPYRSNPQRMEVVSMYKTMFGKDLIEDLKSELSGSFRDVAKFLCMAPAEFDAYLLRKAIKGLGTDEDVLIEVLCTRSNAQIQEIKKKYKEKFNKDLEKDIIGDTSGHFKRLLVTLVQAKRSDSTEVDRNKAHQDAKSLYEAGEKKWGTDESKFNVILGSRSYPQLRAMFEEYKKISKKDIEDALKSEMSGDILRGMLTIVRCVKNKFGHFARQLQKTMKGLGTDDDTLCRVVVSRCEIDMVQIKEEFEKLAGQTLQQYITDDISGDYRNIILALVNGGPPPASSVQSGKGFVEAVKNKTEEELDEEVRLETEKVEADPTVTPFEGFNAEQDSEALRKAMKGFGTDEKAIINILAYRSNEQRVELASKFKTMFGKDLSKELSSELSGNFKTLCLDMLLSSAEFDAKKLNKAVKGLGTDEKVLVEIICTRTNEQLKVIKETYKTTFNKELEADVASDTSGHFKRLLVACLQANRPEEPTFDRNQAKLDAQELLDAGEKKWGTDESRFNVILVSRSYAQLRATFQEYAKLANKDIEDTITSEMSGDLKEGFLAVVKCIRNKAFYFASELHRAMKGLGTDDDTLVRVVGSRCEVDMVQIKEEFQRNFKQTLGMFIKDDTSGDYRTMLLALIRDESVGKKK